MKVLIVIASIIVLLFILKIIKSYKIKKAQIIIDKPCDFGEKMDWLAIKTRDKIAIAKALNFNRTEACNWTIAFQKNQKIFSHYPYISPSIGDWTLVLFVNWSANEKTIREKLSALSSEFGEAQYFASFRQTDTYAWAKYIAGNLQRFYLFGQDKVLVDEGKKDSIEFEFQCHKIIGIYVQEDDEDCTLPSESEVEEMANYWSISPFDIANRTDIKAELGLLAYK